MNIIRHIKIAALELLQLIRVLKADDMRVNTYKARTCARINIARRYVEGEEDILLAPDVRMTLSPSAKVVANKSAFNTYEYPPNPASPDSIGLGVENDSRFIIMPRTRHSELVLKENAVLELHTGVFILPGLFIRAAAGTRTRIGTGCCIGHNFTVNTRCGVSIGNYVQTAADVMIMDYDGHPVWQHPDDNPDRYGGKSAPVIIEDNVWICMKAVILKGVRVGKGSVIGAGAVVTKDVPDHSLVAGNPAKVVREGIKWSAY